MGILPCRELSGREAAETLAVDTVRTELPLPDSGVNVLGANEQVIPLGRFKHDKKTGLSNEPEAEVAVTLVLADSPELIVAADGDAANAIFVVPVAAAVVLQWGE